MIKVRIRVNGKHLRTEHWTYSPRVGETLRLHGYVVRVDGVEWDAIVMSDDLGSMTLECMTVECVCECGCGLLVNKHEVRSGLKYGNQTTFLDALREYDAAWREQVGWALGGKYSVEHLLPRMREAQRVAWKVLGKEAIRSCGDCPFSMKLVSGPVPIKDYCDAPGIHKGAELPEDGTLPAWCPLPIVVERG